MKIKGNLKVSGTTEGITFTDGSTTYERQPRILFNPGDFYLGSDGLGYPKLQLKNHASVMFTDGAGSTYPNAIRLSFASDGFYLSASTSGYPVVNSALDIRQTKVIAIEYPSSSDNVFMFYAPRAMTILSAKAVLVGSASPSVTFSVKSGTDRSSLGTTHTTSVAVTNTTTGTDLVVSSASIPAGSWVSLVTTAKSGTVTELDVSLEVEWS